jgi:hypothetical protein
MFVRSKGLRTVDSSKNEQHLQAILEHAQQIFGNA